MVQVSWPLLKWIRWKSFLATPVRDKNFQTQVWFQDHSLDQCKSEENFFSKGRVGYWSTVTENDTRMHHLWPKKPKNYQERTPWPPPPESGCFTRGSFNKQIHTLPSSALHTFRLFGRNPFWSPTSAYACRVGSYAPLSVRLSSVTWPESSNSTKTQD